MSRGAEYKFIPTDPEDIIIWITSVYEEIMGVTVKPASPDQLFIIRQVHRDADARP